MKVVNKACLNPCLNGTWSLTVPKNGSWNGATVES